MHRIRVKQKIGKGFATLSIAVIGVVSGAFGQLPDRIGPQIGINFANAARSGFPEHVSFTNRVRTGFVAGVVAEWTVSDLILLQCEPHYVQRGASVSETFFFAEEEFTSKAEAKFNYLSIPVVMKLRVPAPGIKPYLLAGPNLSYRLSAVVESAGETREYIDRTESFDLAVEIGAGVEQNLAPFVSLLVDFRVSLGLVDVIKHQSANDPTTWKSRDFKLAATVLFDIS